MPRTRTIGITTLLCFLTLANHVAVPQATPAAGGAATPVTSAATPSAATACPAAFGVFGPLSAPAAAGGGTPAAAATPPVQVTQTVGAPAKPTAPQTPPQTPAPAGAGAANAAGAPAAANAAGAPAKPPKIVQPLTGVIRVDSKLSAADLAAALSGKIPSVTALVPVGRDAIFYTIDPSKLSAPSAGGGGGGSTTPPDPTPAAREVEKRLRDLIGGTGAGSIPLPQMDVDLEVLNLPTGYGHACDIVTAIGHQEPGVVSLSVIDDSRILAGFNGKPSDDRLAELRKLVEDLAVPATAPAEPVTSLAVRLYYERDATSVASVVQSAFSELKSTAISSTSAAAFNDTVVLADPTGRSEVLEQARRMIAQLDEPRPQLTVNAWSLQLSSDQQGKIEELVPQARRLAGEYNDSLQRAILDGWKVLTRQVATGEDFLDSDFANYLCSASVYEAPTGDANAAVRLHAEAAGAGFCGTTDTNHYYGLGYTGLFDQSPPDLIRMLITVAAARNPLDAAERTLDAMEQKHPATPDTTQIPYAGCQRLDEQLLSQDHRSANEMAGEESQWAAEPQLIRRLGAGHAPTAIGFACTRARLQELLNTTPNPSASSFIGQFRAAIADYLFQNKMMAEYPNDFQAFLYPASAAQLDATLTPIVDAFNQDLEALQQHLQHQVTSGVPNDKHLSYASNGLVTVKVVSGNQAQVTTQSQNYFPQNPTMKLEDFAAALVQGQNAAATANAKATGSPVPPILGGTLSAIVPAIAAYSAATPQQVTAKVGSGLAMTVTPYTLSSASGAELAVNVIYNENGAAMISNDTTKSQPNDDLNSRVSEHEVTTMVRMDSLKFFEISTMESVIARQKDRWKPIDPVIELPLLDGLGYGIRRKPQVIYNQSEIFLEATIVPTAADLGNSLLMQYDRIAKDACPLATSAGYMEAHSAKDFCRAWHSGENELRRVMDYHKAVLGYLSRQTIGAEGTVSAGEGLSFPTQDLVTVAVTTEK